MPPSDDATEKRQPMQSPGRNRHSSPRELRASETAARHGLILRKTALRCGGDHDDSARYDLLYERYRQPVAMQVKLRAVEIWLGIRSATRH